MLNLCVNVNNIQGKLLLSSCFYIIKKSSKVQNYLGCYKLDSC